VDTHKFTDYSMPMFTSHAPRTENSRPKKLITCMLSLHTSSHAWKQQKSTAWGSRSNMLATYRMTRLGNKKPTPTGARTTC